MNPRDPKTMGQIVISILGVVGFALFTILAFRYRDVAGMKEILFMLAGVWQGIATMTFGFWVGSSASSQKKDEKLEGKSSS